MRRINQYLVLFASLMIGLSACEFDVCENKAITCLNGGVCENGACNCSDGYFGEDCGQETDFVLEANRTGLKTLDGGSFQVVLSLESESIAPLATFSAGDLPIGVEVSFDSASSSYGCTALVKVADDFKSEAEVDLIATTVSGTAQKVTIRLFNEPSYDPRFYFLTLPDYLLVATKQAVDFDINFYNDGDEEWNDLKFHFEDLPKGCFVNISPNPVSEGYTANCTLHGPNDPGFYEIKLVCVRTVGEHERKEFFMDLIVY